MMTTTVVELSSLEWNVSLAMKEELEPDEINFDPYKARADSIDVSKEIFIKTARQLDEKKVIGRFSTFLEHVKPSINRKTCNEVQWTFSIGKLKKGCRKSLVLKLTTSYFNSLLLARRWKEFGDVNIMGVVHGTGQRFGHEAQEKQLTNISPI